MNKSVKRLWSTITLIITCLVVYAVIFAVVVLKVAETKPFDDHLNISRNIMTTYGDSFTVSIKMTYDADVIFGVSQNGENLIICNLDDNLGYYDYQNDLTDSFDEIIYQCKADNSCTYKFNWEL